MTTRLRPGFRLALLGICLACVGGVNAAPDTGVSVSDSPTITTFGIDAKDYDAIAAKLVADMLADPKLHLDGKKVVVLGPVDDDNCIYYFDARTLQEKLQTALQRSGKLQVSFAADAMGTNTPAAARYDVMRLQWAKESAVDAESLRTFGSLAKVDYLLFGRVSAQTATSKKQAEVTYTFNWKLGDCESGLLGWEDEMERPKSGAVPPEPGWVVQPRLDNTGFFYALGTAEAAKSAKMAKEAALADGRAKLVAKLNAEAHLTTNELVLPFKNEQVAVNAAPGGEFETSLKSGHSCWVLARVSRDAYAKEISDRQKAGAEWLGAEKTWYRATQEYDKKKKKKLQADTVSQLLKLVSEYLVGTQNVVQTEVALFRLAEIERGEDVIAAREYYLQVHDGSSSATWKTKAEEMLAQYPASEEAVQRHLWHKAFADKRVEVACFCKIDGKATTWDEMRTASEEFLSNSNVGAELVRETKFPTADMALEATGNPSTALASALKDHKLDYLIIFTAEGKMNKRADTQPGAPSGNMQFQFDGQVRHVVLAPGKVVEADNGGTALGGWVPISRDFCVGVLARNRFAEWQTNYISIVEK